MPKKAPSADQPVSVRRRRLRRRLSGALLLAIGLGVAAVWPPRSRPRHR